jgi:hypothetical protein
MGAHWNANPQERSTHHESSEAQSSSSLEAYRKFFASKDDGHLRVLPIPRMFIIMLAQNKTNTVTHAHHHNQLVELALISVSAISSILRRLYPVTVPPPLTWLKARRLSKPLILLTTSGLINPLPRLVYTLFRRRRISR